MKENILIVEDEFIVANDLKMKLIKAGYSVCGIAASVDEAEEMIEREKPGWVLLDIFLRHESMGTNLAPKLASKGIGFIYISANTNHSILEIAKETQPYGFLVKPFLERDLLMMLDIARQKHDYNQQLQGQREQLFKMQLSALSGNRDKAEFCEKLPLSLQNVIPFDLLRIVLPAQTDQDEFWFSRVGYEEYQVFGNKEVSTICGIHSGILEINKREHRRTIKPILLKGHSYSRLLLDDVCEKLISSHFKLISQLSVPVLTASGEYVTFIFYSKNEDKYAKSHLNIAKKLTASLKVVAEHLTEDKYLNQRTEHSAARDRKESVPVSRNTAPIKKFDGIIGKSRPLLAVLDLIDLVATSPTSVLITGESGTGKERVAQCIHKMSDRNKKNIVVVNCGALPADLIESELFGHEKGAFTGAVDRKIGKFEQADGGTIFLDEIGELPTDAQVKLLRVLQEMEFERVGGIRSIKVDVRVIAATNRDLENEVAEGNFRLDLYYRLNVFPIHVPALRERKDDIPLLANGFLEKFCVKAGRDLVSISSSAISQLKNYHWPGNIRELEHLVERHCLLSRKGVIDQFILPQSKTTVHVESTIQRPETQTGLKTLDLVETDYIMHVLKECKGRIGVPGGAAAILGMPPSTLHSRMKKLGIKREFSTE